MDLIYVFLFFKTVSGLKAGIIQKYASKENQGNKKY